MEGLRDPNGMMDFRRLLNQFDRDIDYITKEKDEQYSAMNHVCKMMDELENERLIAQKKAADEIKK